jgi:uncharacterized RDD family membrane protein YckC
VNTPEAPPPTALQDAPLQVAQLWPRFGAIVYESVLLFGVSFIASWVVVPLLGEAADGATLAAYRGYLLAVFGIYFIYCWRMSGQTLAMKTWGLRLRRADGQPLTLPMAVGRYALAVAGMLCIGVGFLWALVDRDRQFLHDRLMGTRILRAPF